MKRSVPWAMVWIRAALGPLMVLGRGAGRAHGLPALWCSRKAASYHSSLARAWGLVIAAAMVGAFAFAGGACWCVRRSCSASW